METLIYAAPAVKELKQMSVVNVNENDLILANTRFLNLGVEMKHTKVVVAFKDNGQ